MGLHSTNKLWKKDEMTALIALYETERCLYDNQHKYFNNTEKQKEAYERIHEVMIRIRPSCTVGEIKYKLNYLQRQYIGEMLHRNVSIQGGLCTEQSYKPGMWCFGMLQFLNDFLPMKNAEKATPVVEEEKEKSVAKKSKPQVVNNNVVNEDYKDPETNSDHEAGGSNSVVECNTEIQCNTEETSLNKKQKKRKLDNSITISSPVSVPVPMSMPKIVVENLPVESSCDREDIFGEYVASEMKTLRENPLLYLQTKQSILQILTSANFELINPE